MITKRVILTRGDSSGIYRLNTAVHSVRIAEDELAALVQQTAELSSLSKQLHPSGSTDAGVVAAKEESFADQIFSEFDTNGSGDIDVRELRSALTRWGISVSDDHFEQMMKSYDLDHNGVVDRAEFRRIIQAVGGGGGGGAGEDGGGEGGGAHVAAGGGQGAEGGGEEGGGGGACGGEEIETRSSEDEPESPVNYQKYALQ
jgi:hypothetical protein